MRIQISIRIEKHPKCKLKFVEAKKTAKSEIQKLAAAIVNVSGIYDTVSILA